MDVDVLF